MRTYGVVLAGGVGTRVGLGVPKQFVKVAGKTILEHTISVLDSAPGIDEVIVMIAPGWTHKVAEIVCQRYPKLTRILEGGVTRSDTTRKVIDALGAKEAKLILHDAVRPLLDHRIIADCVNALDCFDAADVVIPSADTIVEVRRGHHCLDSRPFPAAPRPNATGLPPVGSAVRL